MPSTLDVFMLPPIHNLGVGDKSNTEQIGQRAASPDAFGSIARTALYDAKASGLPSPS